MAPILTLEKLVKGIGEKMDKTSLIGIILAIIGVGVGMVMKGVSPSVLVNPAKMADHSCRDHRACYYRLSNKRIKKGSEAFRHLI